MGLIEFLIGFPCVVAAVLLVVKGDGARTAVVSVSAAVIAAASVVLAVMYLGQGSVFFEASSHVVDYVCMGIGVAIAACIVAYGVRYKNVAAIVLAVVQITVSLVFEIGFAHGVEVERGLYLDTLSLIMALIIGIVGSGICVYALGYMQDFQEHENHENSDAKDRRTVFFALMFLFLAAMYVIVFANNMTWMFTGWEITTLCSFLLIGYTKTDEAIANAFRQIIMNLLGGIAFAVALIYSATSMGTLELDLFLETGALAPAVAYLPVALLAFAGMTKAAQMPFHTWLLGAMVAPTPTSALLHSSTMVKAGVFMLVKLSPVLAVSPIPALMVVLVGGFTFMLCSFMAISQSNAKRVLAYSTIANLGLITACAGVGTPEAVWAAVFLIVFHAVAKSLLFLCVGTAEHHIGSRNIEDMDLLFQRMPNLARLMMLGIMAMFVAPFGMLVAKWATLVSFAETGNVALIILLAFGSAATFMFWAKWLGKLAGIAASPENVEKTVHPSEWFSLRLMAVLTVAACVLLPVESSGVVEPYLASVFGEAAAGVGDLNLWISAVCAVFVVVLLFAGLGRGKRRHVDIYLAGASADNAARTFRGSLSTPVEATSRNLYLGDYFGEKAITPVGTVLCSVIMAAAILYALVAVAGLF